MHAILPFRADRSVAYGPIFRRNSFPDPHLFPTLRQFLSSAKSSSSSFRRLAAQADCCTRQSGNCLSIMRDLLHSCRLMITACGLLTAGCATGPGGPLAANREATPVLVSQRTPDPGVVRAQDDSSGLW